MNPLACPLSSVLCVLRPLRSLCVMEAASCKPQAASKRLGGSLGPPSVQSAESVDRPPPPAAVALLGVLGASLVDPSSPRCLRLCCLCSLCVRVSGLRICGLMLRAPFACFRVFRGPAPTMQSGVEPPHSKGSRTVGSAMREAGRGGKREYRMSKGGVAASCEWLGTPGPSPFDLAQGRLRRGQPRPLVLSVRLLWPPWSRACVHDGSEIPPLGYRLGRDDGVLAAVSFVPSVPGTLQRGTRGFAQGMEARFGLEACGRQVERRDLGSGVLCVAPHQGRPWPQV